MYRCIYDYILYILIILICYTLHHIYTVIYHYYQYISISVHHYYILCTVYFNLHTILYCIPCTLHSEISTNHLSRIERHHIIFLFDAKPNPATPKKISSTHADKYLISPSSSYRPSLLLPILPLSLFFEV